MLIRFSVSNFLSFKGTQTLSMEAGRQGGAGRGGRSYNTGVKGAPNLLHGAVIYGANSGGKTNLIAAIRNWQEFVVQSASSQPDEKAGFTPYRLDSSCESSPSQLEGIFLVDGTVYQYGFAADEDIVHAEWLYETPKEGRIRHLFSREIRENGTYEWYVNPRIKGERRSWQESTRDNALFLSTAVRLNAQELRVPYDWIREKLRVIQSARVLSDFTSTLCNREDTRSEIVNIMQAVDVGVADVVAIESEFDMSEIPSGIPDEVRVQLEKELRGKKVFEPLIGRKDVNGKTVLFDMEEESTGTSILYSLAGPWYDTLKNGFTLVIDELDSGLHPLAFRALVSMFFDKTLNPGHAQLIVTCHEATLLRDDLLRSDQVWFIDKTAKEGSKLYPLSEFKPRNNESFLRGYLGGRYGGVPLARGV